MLDLNLASKSMSELVAIYVKMTGKTETTDKTFSQKSKAIEAITKARTRGHTIITDLMKKTVENGCTSSEEMASFSKVQELVAKYELDRANYPLPAGVKARSDERKAAKEAAKAPKPEAPKAEEPKAEASKAEAPKAEEPKKASGRIIRVASEELLRAVSHKNDNGDDVGYTYTEILEKVKAEFPKGKTSIACLRWYHSHMSTQGIKLPTRPRANSKG